MRLDDFDGVLFDLDGTIYYGETIINGANETINYLRNKDKKIFFTTNNSTKTRKQIFERLKRIGVNCYLEEVLTSGFLATTYAKRHKLKNIYILGSKNLIEEFEEQGIHVTQSEDAENLLIGYNPDMTYEELTVAVNVALHAKRIIACNKERVYPGPNARLMPGCGAMTAPVEWCANRQADVVIGKPNTLMISYLDILAKISPDRLLVIGDTYESDVAMANNAGALSILLSDVEYDDTVVIPEIKMIPDYFEKK